MLHGGALCGSSCIGVKDNVTAVLYSRAGGGAVQNTIRTVDVKDGISLVKTAEGAMQEIQDMLNRMDYLATQSANGTYQDAAFLLFSLLHIGRVSQ